MFSSHRNFIHSLLSTFFLIAFIASCTPVSSSSGSSGGVPSAAGTAVQLKSLGAGIIVDSGSGSQGDPFKILIDESVSLSGYPLELSELFSNVESVAAGTDSPALLNVREQTVKTSLGSKLSIELSGANGEKKYAELYFQNSARITDAVQRGEAVLPMTDRGAIAKGDSSDADAVKVTLYKKSDGSRGSVKPTSLFDYDSDNFTVTAYNADENGQFSDAEEIDLADEVTAAATIRLVFTPNEGVDKLLFPERSQILHIILDNKQISSLAFDKSKWPTGLSNGESSTDAPVLVQAWNKALDLSSYVKKDDSETLTVRLHKAENLELTPPAGKIVAEDGTLTPPEFAENDNTKYKFNLKSESASAIFEFSTPESKTIFGKKLYVKVKLTLPASTIDKADTLTNLTADDNNTGDGLENSPYAFNVTKDEGVGLLSALVKNSAGDLTFALKSSTDSEFTNLAADTTALRVSSGELAAGNLTAGVWTLRINDAGSAEYAAKNLYFKLTFPLGSSSLALGASYSSDNGSGTSQENPLEVTVPTAGITLANLTTAASTGRTLRYEVVTAGSGLTRGTTIDVNTKPSLKIGDTVGTATISRGIFVLKVSEEADDYREGAAFYFKLIFETESTVLRVHVDYADQGDGRDAPIEVPEIAEGASLTLSDLIATYDGTVAYALSREGVSESPLASNITSLSIGDDSIDSTGPWTIKVTGTLDEKSETLTFRVTFAKNSSTFQKSDSYSATGSGTEGAPYLSTVAADASLNLASLTTGKSAGGTLSYTVDGTTATVASLKVGEPLVAEGVALTAGDKTIIVNDDGDAVTAAGTITFKVSFTKNSSTFKKSDSYSATGSGTEGAPYLSTVAADASLNLASLTTGKSAGGTLSYTVNGTAATVESLKVGDPVAEGTDLTAGDKTIIVNDPGDAFTAAGTIIFKVNFTKNSSTFKKSDSYTITAGDGTENTPYLSTVAADASLNLASLTTGKSAGGTLSYTVDGTAATVASLKVGESLVAGGVALTAGDKTIIVNDPGDDFTAGKLITFKVTFVKNSSTFKKSDSYTITAGDGTENTPYLSTVAADASLTLADLTSGQSSGDLIYTVDGTETTETSLKTGDVFAETTRLDPGDKTIIVNDPGDAYTAAGTIYFKVSFTKNTSSLVKKSDYNTTSGTGSSSAPYLSTVAADASLTLADLTSGQSSGTLIYTVGGTATTETSLKVGEPVAEGATLTAGDKTIIVTDNGDDFTEIGTITFKITFSLGSSSLGLVDDYDDGGDGSLEDPVVVTVPTSGITLANLTTVASTGKTLKYEVVDAGSSGLALESISNTSLKIGDTVGQVTLARSAFVLKVSEEADDYREGSAFYFKLIFETASTMLRAHADYANQSDKGSENDPIIVSEIAQNKSLTLANLIASYDGTVTYALSRAGVSESVLGSEITSLSIAQGSIDDVGPWTIKVSGTPSAGGPETLYFQVTFAKSQMSRAASTAAVNIGTQSGEDSENAIVVRNASGDDIVAFATGDTLNLSALVDNESSNVTYNDGSAVEGASITNYPINNGADINLTIADSAQSSSTHVAKTLHFKIIVKRQVSNFALKSSLPNSREASGNGTSYDDPFVISGTFPGNTAIDLTALVDEDSASAADNLTYTTVTSADDTTGISISTPASALNNRAVTSVVVRVVDAGSDTVAAKTIFLKLSFVKAANNFALKSSLPNTRTASGSGTSYDDPFVISGTFTANTAVNLKAFVDEDSASAADNLTYTTVTSADDTTGTSISTPAAALSDQVGKAVVVRVVDAGSDTVEAKTIFLELIFVAVIPAADGHYNPALQRGGPEVQLTGSMAAGEISFSVGLLSYNSTASSERGEDIVIYSAFNSNNREFALFYDNEGLQLYISPSIINPDSHVAKLSTDFPAGTYDFTLHKTPSANGYTVTILVDGLELNNNTHEISSGFDAFFNPMIGADVRDANRRPVRVVHDVAWTFQPFALVSHFGGSDFSRLTNDASVGLTFVVRVPGLAAGESLELFSVTASAAPVSLGTKTVGAGETSLEFKVSGLTHGTSYEFLVRAAGSNESFSDLLRSVAVTVDTSVRETTAAFIGLNNNAALQNNSANLQKLTVTPPDGGFKTGDKIYLYELNSSNEKVAIGESTALLYEFNAESSDAQELSLSEIPFENKVYQLVVEVMTASANKADSNFTIGAGEADRIFNVTFDSRPPQLSFDFSDASNLVISANEALASGLKTAIESGLTFTGAQGNSLSITSTTTWNSLSITPTATYRTDSSDYKVRLSPALGTGAVLNLAAGAVTDVSGNGNVGVQQNVLPSLLSIVANSNRIDASSTDTNLTFSFAQEIDASTFNPADDLEFINSSGTVITSNLLTLDKVTSNDSKTIQVTLTATNGFDNQVRVKMKSGNQVSLSGSSLAATVEGESPLIDIDLKAPTPTVSFAATQVAPEKTIQFTLSFDETVTVTETLEVTDFQVGTTGSLVDATAAILSNISRKDDRTFTGTLTAPNAETTAYSLIFKTNTVTDAYGNSNGASVAATVNVVSNAVPVPSFSAPLLARHGGSTTLTISFPETVTGFEVGDLVVIDAGENTDTVVSSNFSQTENDNKVYTVTLTTQSAWVSGAVTVTVAAEAYQNSSNAGNSPALSYTIPVSNALSTPSLVSVTGGDKTVAASSDTEVLPLSVISVKVNVSAVAGDRLLLFLGDNQVPIVTQPITATGTATGEQAIDIADSNSKVNGSRLAYRVRLQDAQGNLSESSRLLYVSFADFSAATAPQILGPVTNVSFADDFSLEATNWQFQGTEGAAAIENGEFRLTKAENVQSTLVTQNDLIFSTQGKVVFEATFIFGNDGGTNPADGMAFFTYDARDELFYSGRTYDGGGALGIVGGNKNLRSLFFAIGLDEYQDDEFKYAPPGNSPANLADLGEPTGGNTSTWHRSHSNISWTNARHRLRITVENRSVLVQHANVNARGVVDENSWMRIPHFSRTFPDTAYIPDNIKIGFSATTGGANNYHAIDDVNVDAELFVPYTVGANPVQAAPRGITLTEGKQADNSLAISRMSVQISSGYQAADSLTFSGDSTLFTPTLSGDTLSISAAAEQSPTTAQFLAALNAIRFSATAVGERTLSWQVFADDADSVITSQFYNSEIRVSDAN